MKKLLCVCLCLCLLGSVTAHADVIWEPYDDSFYLNRQGDFLLTQENYYVNSPYGAADVYDKPSGRVIDTLENGQGFYVYYTYEDKNGVWALDDDGRYVLLSELLNVYDKEFWADHEGEIVSEAPEGLHLELQAQEPILAWTYPGGRNWETTVWEAEDVVNSCTAFYTDEDGRIWGYINYWYGRLDAWVCLTSHYDRTLELDEIYTGTVYFGPDAAPLTPKPEAEAVFPWGIVLPVAAALGAGAALLLWPKKKKPQAKS